MRWDEFDLERVEAALAELSPGLDPLAAADRLRRALPPGWGPEAALLRELRVRARRKLRDPAQLLLTRKGLEQATSALVAAERAKRIAERCPGTWVFDATAGIGGDSLELAARRIPVLAADIELRHALCLRGNLRGRGAAARVVQADANHPPLRPSWSERAVWLLDPDRRPGVAAGDRRRRGDPETWSPRWSRCLDLVRKVRGAAVKLPPALEPEELASAALANQPHSWQWVSLQGELRELVLWTGALASPGGPDRREALVLTHRGTAAHVAGERSQLANLSPAVAADVPWIAEPDPAVTRAGLTGQVARTAGLAALAPGLAYLGGDRPPPSPLYTAWPVLGHTALDQKRVRALLATHDIGRLTVKKRGHPDSAETLARRFGGRGQHRGLLIVARLPSGHRAYLVGQATERN